jgi:hypothetical protein
MPKASLADFLTDWEKLLKNVNDTAADLPNIDVQRNNLDQLLTQARGSLALAAAQIGIKQQETKDRQAFLKDGKDAASRLRSAIKSHLGAKSEILLRYGIKPIRKRVKKPTEAVKEKPKPETPAPASHSEPTPQTS